MTRISLLNIYMQTNSMVYMINTYLSFKYTKYLIDKTSLLYIYYKIHLQNQTVFNKISIYHSKLKLKFNKMTNFKIFSN